MSLEYIVLWDGSHHGIDADLLCVQPPPTPNSERPIAMPVPWQTRRTPHAIAADRRLLLDLLGDRALARGTLHAISRLPLCPFQVAFDGLVREREIEPTGRRAWWRRA